MAYIGRTTDGFGVRQRFVFTPNAGTTSISGNDVSGATLTFSDSVYMDVFLNGVLLKAGTDYNTNTANTIAGLTATVANDEVTVLVYDIFTTADMVSATSGGTFSGNVTHSGTVTVDDTTDSTSTTTGSIQTDGGLGVAKDVVIGDDLFLKSDSAVLNFGADNDINITHVADTGLTTNGDFSVGDDLKLTSDGAVLGFGADNEITVTHVADTGLRFEDSDKLLFGAGADLEIFHDGSNSFVSDTGTGDLRITGSVIRLLADNVVISNAANNEDMITAAADGAVNLRHNNVSCLTTTSDGGIDIEGGDIIFSTADKGIVLGATSNTDANTLADYEEGTFTWGSNANVSFQSSSNVGKYTKIGSMVYVQFWMDLASVTSTNHFYANSMPFLNGANTTNTINGNSIGSCSLYNVNFDDTATTTMPILDSGSSTVYFYHAKDNSNWDIMINSEMTSTSEVGVTLSYMTDL